MRIKVPENLDSTFYSEGQTITNFANFCILSPCRCACSVEGTDMRWLNE